jgi:hypothetical protein
MDGYVPATGALPAPNSKGQPLVGRRNLKFQRTGTFNRFDALAGKDGEVAADGEEHVAAAAEDGEEHFAAAAEDGEEHAAAAAEDVEEHVYRVPWGRRLAFVLVLCAVSVLLLRAYEIYLIWLEIVAPSSSTH